MTRMMMVALLVLWGLALTAIAMDVALQWNPNSEPGLIGYKVYYGNYSGSSRLFPSAGTINVNKPGTSATVTGLDPLKNWFFRVTAYNATNESLYSNVVGVTYISAPGNLQYTIINGGLVLK